MQICPVSRQRWPRAFSICRNSAVSESSERKPEFFNPSGQPWKFTDHTVIADQLNLALPPISPQKPQQLSAFTVLHGGVIHHFHIAVGGRVHHREQAPQIMSHSRLAI